MENTELQKLANAITFGGNRGKAEFITDVAFFMKQVKQKKLGSFNDVSKVLILQGEPGVGKSTLAKKISDTYALAHTKGVSVGLYQTYCTDYSVIELSELKLTKGELEKVIQLSTWISVSKRVPPAEKEMQQHSVISSLICTSQRMKELKEGRRLKPFIIESMDFEAVNAVDFSKIYQAI